MEGGVPGNPKNWEYPNWSSDMTNGILVWFSQRFFGSMGGGGNEFIPGNVGVKITNGYVSQEISPFV